MKKVLALLIALSFLLQCTVQFAVLAAFELRKDYIARNLCENRNKPQMKCCGKCVLNKQLKKVSTNDETAKNELVHIDLLKLSPCLLPHSATINYTFAAHSSLILNPICPAFTDRLGECAVFHPPSFAVS